MKILLNRAWAAEQNTVRLKTVIFKNIWKNYSMLKPLIFLVLTIVAFSSFADEYDKENFKIKSSLNQNMYF